ncbi:MAG: hypothetical protein JXR39_01280 [Marinilabiliaceae bacterium]|nr:hypothetical protein [Marinilabiliaceae bacterium]
MRAKNIKDIIRGYFLFFSGLISSVGLAILVVCCFVHTTSVEVRHMARKTVEYDQMNLIQQVMVTRMDTLCHLMSLLNTSEKINEVKLQNLISTKKMNLMNDLIKLPERDIRLFQLVTSQINTFLNVKDSIRIMSTQEDLVKIDLMRCIEDNKKASRKLTLGDIVIEE